jgi:hypothetical protein
MTLTWPQAIKNQEHRLEDLIQQDAAGVAPVYEKAFLKAASKLIKHVQDQI